MTPIIAIAHEQTAPSFIAQLITKEKLSLLEQCPAYEERSEYL